VITRSVAVEVTWCFVPVHGRHYHPYSGSGNYKAICRRLPQCQCWLSTPARVPVPEHRHRDCSEGERARAFNTWYWTRCRALISYHLPWRPNGAWTHAGLLFSREREKGAIPCLQACGPIYAPEPCGLLFEARQCRFWDGILHPNDPARGNKGLSNPLYRRKNDSRLPVPRHPAEGLIGDLTVEPPRTSWKSSASQSPVSNRSATPYR
jgi:hypothetical protein